MSATVCFLLGGILFGSFVQEQPGFAGIGRASRSCGQQIAAVFARLFLFSTKFNPV
jgi:hypothetical protein